MLLSYLRTVILYLILILVIRVMGKRQVGEMEPTEFVVTMLVANLASIPMQDGAIPLYTGLVPILTVLGLEILLSVWALRSVRIRRLLCGKPVILIENGRVLQKNLRRTRITMDELVGQLREKDVLDLTAVQYAILETDGKLSVFPYAQYLPAGAKEAGIEVKQRLLPVTLMVDGCLYRDNLPLAGKSEAWVQAYLEKQKLKPEEVWFFTVDGAGRTVLIKKEADGCDFGSA